MIALLVPYIAMLAVPFVLFIVTATVKADQKPQSEAERNAEMRQMVVNEPHKVRAVITLVWVIAMLSVTGVVGLWATAFGADPLTAAVSAAAAGFLVASVLSCMAWLGAKVHGR